MHGMALKVQTSELLLQTSLQESYQLVINLMVKNLSAVLYVINPYTLLEDTPDRRICQRLRSMDHRS